MKTITIEGQLRTGFGKAASRQIRSEGKVPAVIYGGAKEVNFSAPEGAFRSIIYTSEFMLAEVQVDGKSYNCVLKDLQFDKVTDALIHVDFLELVPGKKVIVNVPVTYTGTPIGVREGGKLVVKMKSLRVKVLPEHLKETIDVDITSMKVGDNIRVQDVKAENMEILNSPRIPVVSVTTTRQLRQEDSKGAAAKGAAEGTAAGDAAKA
ncbi:MAG: 50S ribosomal protein L25 [Chitinophagaceae bacterium]|nr:50S ribosomal protein L25 [Chitinophagaceae bacterium]